MQIKRFNKFQLYIMLTVAQQKSEQSYLTVTLLAPPKKIYATAWGKQRHKDVAIDKIMEFGESVKIKYKKRKKKNKFSIVFKAAKFFKIKWPYFHFKLKRGFLSFWLCAIFTTVFACIHNDWDIEQSNGIG